MKLEGLHKLKLRDYHLTSALSDLEMVRRCIRGCEQFQKIDDHSYAATIRTSVNGLEKPFRGTLRFENGEAPGVYLVLIEGKCEQGSLSASGEVELKPKRRSVIVRYNGDFHIAGLIAKADEQFLRGAAKLFVCQFFMSLATETRKLSGPSENRLRKLWRWITGDQ